MLAPEIEREIPRRGFDQASFGQDLAPRELARD
jgi:hypothetical protein